MEQQQAAQTAQQLESRRRRRLNYAALASQRGKRGIAEFAGLEFAGVENDGQSRRGGICRTGK